MSKKAKREALSPQDQVRRLIKKGKLKSKCCRSKPRCKKCPVTALEKAKQKAR